MLSAPRSAGILPSLESAFEEEGNLLLRLQHQNATRSLRHLLWEDRSSIAGIVRHHLGLARDEDCTVLPPASWIQGAFNICIFVEVTKQGVSPKKFIFRCPMPHKLAEPQHPGTIDEKVSCEAASYIWMQEHCTDVQIPHLYGFGFADGRHFTHVDKMSICHRVYRGLYRWVHRFLGLPLLSSYVHNTSAPAVRTAYTILEYIGPETGRMLSDSWAECWNDVARRGRLYRGLARIMLSLARIPQRSIGAYRFNTSDSTVTLTNRPLTCSAIIMENSGAPRTMQPRQTYQSAESFTSDILTLHDNYLLHQPHAVRDEEDAYERFAMRLLLRTVSHHFILPRWRDGPYVLQLTDLHQSNIFVDSEWNVVAMIDLEWICSLPVEMLSVPYWLTGCSIDGIIDKEYEAFNEARQEFLAAMDDEAETTSLKPKHGIPLTLIMREMWLSKGVWFWACVRSLNGWLFVFEDHIVPKFSNDKKFITRVKGVAALWQEDLESIVKAKVDDEDRYKRELRTCYEGISQE